VVEAPEDSLGAPLLTGAALAPPPTGMCTDPVTDPPLKPDEPTVTEPSTGTTSIDVRVPAVPDPCGPSADDAAWGTTDPAS
jgi:hypothetical protein